MASSIQKMNKKQVHIIISEDDDGGGDGGMCVSRCKFINKTKVCSFLLS